MISETTRAYYARQRREEAEGRASIIRRYRSLLAAAASTRFASLASQYSKGATQLRARHQLTAEEIAS